MRIIEIYKKSIFICVLLAIFSSLIYFGIDIMLFESLSIRISFEFDILFEYIIQISVLIMGLLFYHKVDPSIFIEQLKKGLLISTLYAIFTGEFHQMIYPQSEFQTLLDKLILNLVHSWIIITIGFGFVIIKYLYQTLKSKKHDANQIGG